MADQYYVANENALVYATEVEGLYGVLAGKILRGGPNWMDGPINVSNDNLRPATAADFDDYRVSTGGYNL